MKKLLTIISLMATCAFAQDFVLTNTVPVDQPLTVTNNTVVTYLPVIIRDTNRINEINEFLAGKNNPVICLTNLPTSIVLTKEYFSDGPVPGGQSGYQFRVIVTP